MANKILHTTIMQKNTAGGKNIIYPKTVTKNIIDGSSTLDKTLNTLKSPDMSAKTTTFTQASRRENLVSGETLATSHGKIMKLISDLKSFAYLDTVGVSNLDPTLVSAYNNRITTDKVTTSTTITSAGYVADARAVNDLQTQINTVNTNMNIKMLDGVDVYTLNDGRYYVTNGINMPPNHPHGYIFVNRILNDYAWIFYADPYNPDTTTAFNKQGEGVWLGWNNYVTHSDLENQSSLLKGGTSLASGTDLNNIQVIGNYFVHLNVIAETLKNSPTQYAFSLKVSSGVGNGDSAYIIQELTSYTGEKYIRQYNAGNNYPWSSWKKYVLYGDLKRHFYDYNTITTDKEYAIQDIFYKLPADSDIHYVNVYRGNHFCLIVQKYSDHLYGSVLRFGYLDTLAQYRVVNGVWYKMNISYAESQIEKLV